VPVSDEISPVSQPTFDRTSEASQSGGAETIASSRHRDTSGFFRFSVSQFLVALVLMLIINPFVPEYQGGEFISGGLMTLVLITAVLAVGGTRRVLGMTILLVVPALAAEWVDRYRPDLVPRWIISGVGLVFVGFVVIQLLRFVLRAPRVSAEVLCAGISAYLMLGLLWAAAYLLVARLTPGAFTLLYGAARTGRMERFDTLCFSFGSLTSLGCNDIVPVTRVARMLTVVESTTGVLYLAVMMARLVALYSNAERKRPDRANH
jgi:Ion channel